MSTDFAMHRARPDHLLSKLVAGGLSAGVVLLWWPHVFAHDSAASWVWRGIGWTLLAELLVVALSPLEHALRASLARVAPLGRVRGRLSPSPRQRAHLALVLGLLALGLPLTLIATGRPAPAQQPRRVTNVTRVVKVVKRVQVRRIVVRRAAPAAAAGAAPVPTATAAPARAVATPRPASNTTAATDARDPQSSSSDAAERTATTPTPTPSAAPVASPVATPASGA